jgi:hypothetical protein
MSLMEYDTKKDNQEKTVFEDKTFWYVHKKSQRIAEAVYLVTQNVAKEEPLKVALRTCCVRLVEVVTDTYSSYIKDREEGARRIALVLTELSALLDVAATARVVSPMNHTIVRHEVAQLVSLLLERYAAVERSDTLDTSFFKDASLKFPERTATASAPSVRRSVPDASDQRMSDSSRTSTPGTPASIVRVSDILAGTSMADTTPRVKTVSNSVSRVRAEGISDAAVRRVRRDTIVSFIKDKGRVSIKDVASIITDVSEKTLQRELLSLVDEGELLKVGERRWSTYEVAPGK